MPPADEERSAARWRGVAKPVRALLRQPGDEMMLAFDVLPQWTADRINVHPPSLLDFISRSVDTVAAGRGAKGSIRPGRQCAVGGIWRGKNIKF